MFVYIINVSLLRTRAQTVFYEWGHLIKSLKTSTLTQKVHVVLHWEAEVRSQDAKESVEKKKNLSSRSSQIITCYR